MDEQHFSPVINGNSTTGTGRQWAALKKSSSVNTGSISVRVSGFSGSTYIEDTYTRFAASCLSEDLRYIALGIFVGESVTILDMLGQSGLVHINCHSCSVSNVQLSENDSDWFAQVVRVLASLGIINGYPDGTFHPNANITRAEFTAMAMRFAKEAPGEMDFTDVPVGHWAYDYIASASYYGWINGYVNKTFLPENQITRAEVVTIVNHMLGRVCDEEYVMANWSSIVQFTDLQNNHLWYFYDMVEATNGHDYEKPENEDESWTGLK